MWLFVVPRLGGNNLHLYVDVHLCLYNCILFCIFSCFYLGRAKFNKFDCIWALCIFICLCKFEIIQYILKYKCICICILSYYTYSDTEYSASLFVSITWVLYCLFSCFSNLHLPLGVLCPSLRGGYSNCPPNRGIYSKSLVFGLKVQ